MIIPLKEEVVQGEGEEEEGEVSQLEGRGEDLMYGLKWMDEILIILVLFLIFVAYQ